MITTLLRLLPLLVSAIAFADDPWLARLQPSDPAHAPGFGETVALGGSDLLAVGAPDALGTGVVVIFRRDPSGWVEETVIVPSGMSSGARFGAALYFTGGILSVGAPMASPGGIAECGEVRQYSRFPGPVWSLRMAVQSNLPVTGGHFGAAVHGSGWLFVGEPGNGPGRVTLWTTPTGPDDSWQPSGAAPDARFGAAIAPSNNRPAWCAELYLLIGAPGARGVYGLNECHGLLSLVGLFSDPTRPGFGRSIASQFLIPPVGWVGERVAVGHDGPGVVIRTDLGMSFNYDDHIESLTAFDAPSVSDFGLAFAFAESNAGDGVGHLVVGDPDSLMAGGAGSGGAYRFLFPGTEAVDAGPLAPYAHGPHEAAGSSIDASGSAVALGTPGAQVVQVFDTSRLIGTPWCASAPSSLDRTPSVYGFGSPVLSDRRLGFMGVGLPPGAFHMLLGSPNEEWTPLGSPYAGFQCVGSPFLRFTGQVSAADPAGRATARVDPLALPGGGLIAPGDSWVFQFWYRDTTPTSAANTTHAVRITFE